MIFVRRYSHVVRGDIVVDAYDLEHRSKFRMLLGLTDYFILQEQKLRIMHVLLCASTRYRGLGTWQVSPKPDSSITDGRLHFSRILRSPTPTRLSDFGHWCRLSRQLFKHPAENLPALVQIRHPEPFIVEMCMVTGLTTGQIRRRRGELLLQEANGRDRSSLADVDRFYRRRSGGSKQR